MGVKEVIDTDVCPFDELQDAWPDTVVVYWMPSLKHHCSSALASDSGMPNMLGCFTTGDGGRLTRQGTPTTPETVTIDEAHNIAIRDGRDGYVLVCGSLSKIVATRYVR